MTPQELKKAIRAAGFDVYRTTPAGVVLAERVRENQIMDAGIQLAGAGPVEVTVRFRAEKHVFPGLDDDALFQKAVDLAAPAIALGFAEARREAAAQMSPSDRTVQLDVFYEVFVARTVATLDDAFALLRDAFRWERALTAR